MSAIFIAVAIVGYLIGSIPFGVLVSRRFTRADIRDFGSGKVGATNVLRTALKTSAYMAQTKDGVFW